MTRLAAALAMCALLAPAALAGQNDSLVVRETARPCARVRQRPDPGARSMACLAPGTRVAGTGVAPFWRKVRLSDGRTGWIAKQALARVAHKMPVRCRFVGRRLAV